MKIFLIKYELCLNIDSMLYSMDVFNLSHVFWIPSALISVISTSPQAEPEIMALISWF